MGYLNGRTQTKITSGIDEGATFLKARSNL